MSDDVAAGRGPRGGAATARSLTVRGRVQGVFFRASTRRVADEAGVVGWAVNRPDGSVELWLEGSREAVASVESWVRAGGPQDAVVETVEASDRAAAGHERFEVH